MPHLQYMLFIIIAATFIFIIPGLGKELTFQHHFGLFSFDPGITKQQAYYNHLQSPLVLYSLATVEVKSVFAYWSSYQTVEALPEDKLIISVEIRGVSTYKITVYYFVVEQMPNIEAGAINLTWAKPNKLFKSYKGLLFGTATQLTAHLIGFSSSNFTNQNYFFAMKGTTTYNVYTKVNLTNQQWIAINFIIVQPSYSKDDITCHGSHVTSASQVRPSKQLIPIYTQKGQELPFLLGIEAIYNEKCGFRFTEENSINVSSGSYSYSVVFFNTTCIVESKSYARMTQRALVYLVVMVVFVVLCGVVVVICLLYCVLLVRGDEEKEERSIEENPIKGGREGEEEEIEVELGRVTDVGSGTRNQRRGEQSQQQEESEEEGEEEEEDGEEGQQQDEEVMTQAIREEWLEEG